PCFPFSGRRVFPPDSRDEEENGADMYVDSINVITQEWACVLLQTLTHTLTRSLPGSSPAHLAEKVHDLFAAAGGALVGARVFIRVCEFAALLQLAASLFLVAAHALGVLCTLRLGAVRLRWRHLLAGLR
ncbi:hypothetical protein CPI04_08735, partial [Moraxella catarrhalis]|nr:hypothetical protein [Moraxella catarrhalis]